MRVVERVALNQWGCAPIRELRATHVLLQLRAQVLGLGHRLPSRATPARPYVTSEAMRRATPSAGVELELAGRDADAAVPGMRAHLPGCPACHEDHDSLAALVSSELHPRSA
jgi:hypothetical protein